MGRLMRIAVAILVVASLAVPATLAAQQPTISVESGNDFSRPLAGSVVTYKILFEAKAADGQSLVDLRLGFLQNEADAVAWPSTLTLTRIGSGTTTNIGTLSGFENPVIHEDLFEGRYELAVRVPTEDVVKDFPMFIEFAVAIPNQQQMHVGGVHRYDFLLQPPPDDDGDGLSNAKEKELGSDPKKWDTDGDELSDCREVKHTVDSECKDFHFTEVDGGYGTDPLKADTDGDGLRDDLEVRFGTDPTKADTDGDGLNDCQETRHRKAGECGKIAPTLEDGGYGTDPWVADQDEDGLMEGDEIKAGSDPFNEDSDDDGLLDGEEFHGTLNSAYGNAATDPMKKDSDGDGLIDQEEIVTYGTDPNKKDTDGDGLDDNEEVAGPNSPLEADSDSDGLNDFDERRVHRTDPANPDSDDDGLSDGDEINAWKTQVLHPDSDGDALSDGDEVHLHGTDPLYHDSDDDGLNDGKEVHEYGTDPASPDTDNDGLSDGDEFSKWKTDPTRADTDDDFLEDGNETIRGTDPLNPDSDGDGWLDGKEVRYGGEPLDRSVTPSDVDGDLLADLEDADADGDGRSDEDAIVEASSTITSSFTPSSAPHMKDMDPGGHVRTSFSFTLHDDADGVRLWRFNATGWTLVGESTGQTIEDAQGMDGAAYRITAYKQIGAKRVGGGGPADVSGFDALPAWELFVTGGRVVGDELILRSEQSREFHIRVAHSGDHGDHTFSVVSRSQSNVPLAGLLEGVEGAYSVQWIDGDEAYTLHTGQVEKTKSPLSALSGASVVAWVTGASVLGLLLVGIGVLFIVRRQRLG